MGTESRGAPPPLRRLPMLARRAAAQAWVCASKRVTARPSPSTSAFANPSLNVNQSRSPLSIGVALNIVHLDHSELQTVFSSYDTDGNGVLSREEVTAVLEQSC